MDVFFPLQIDETLPDIFPSPFEVVPHSVAGKAAASLKSRIPELCNHLFDRDNGGKMFGVLVVKNTDNETGYLSAFSGMLGQDWNVHGFVPPVFDQSQRDSIQLNGEAELLELSHTIEKIQSDAAFVQLQQQLSAYELLKTSILIKKVCAKRKEKNLKSMSSL